MDPGRLIANAQDQAEQAYQNGVGAMPSAGSTTDQSNVAAAQTALQQPPTQPQVTPAAHPTSLLERLLPTIGGVLGGIGAGAADIFTGGAAIPFDAAIAGAGSALGKVGENALTHESLGNGVLGSGLEGAVGQAGGALAGAALGKAGGALGNIAKNKLAGQATEGATQDTIDQATALKNAYADVPKGLRQAYNAKGQTDFITKLGMDAANPKNLVDTGTSANDVLSSNLNDALSGSGSVDLSEYNNIVKNALASRSGTLGSYDKVAVGRGRLGFANTPAAKLLQDLEQHGMGTASASADPIAVRQLISKIQGMAADAKPGISAATGAVDPVQKSTYDALNQVSGDLKNTLYNRPEVNDAISSLQGNIQAGDVAGNQALADHLNTVLSGASKGQDVLDELSRFTNMNKLGNSALKAQQDIASPATLARVKTQETPQAGDGIFNKNNLLNIGSLAEGTIGHHPIALMAPLLAHAAQNPGVLNGTGSILGSIGASALPGVAGQVIANSPNDVTMGAGGAGDISLNQGQSMNPQNSMTRDAIIADLYNAGNGGLAQLPGAIKSNQAANEAQAAEQSLAQNFNGAGGAQGPIGGILNRIGATFTGGEAANYGPQAQQAAEVIANALGVPASSITTPKITQNQTAAQASLGNIQSLIQALMNPQGASQPGVVNSLQ